MHDPIVITGIGIVSPLGLDTATTWQNLMAGKSGIDVIKNFDVTHFPTRIAAEVKNFDAEIIDDKKILRQSLNFTRYALAAADQAFADAGIRPQKNNAARWGLVAGSGMMTAEYEYWCEFQKMFATEGELSLEKVASDDTFFTLSEFAKTTPNGALALMLKRYGIRGYANSVHTACASGGQALGLALQAMRRGETDYMLAGGFDSMINPLGLSSFILLGALSTYNDTPQAASRPFDLTRNGFVLGEGAAFMVLETLSRARARGAKIYAELAGEGNSISSYRITDSHPSGDGAIQAIQWALRDARVTADAVDYINAHGTSTMMNDLSESNAIKQVFGARAQSIPVSSTKSQTGHLIAAAGALEAAICALAITHQTVPMTANLTTPDPDCDLDFITEGPRACQVNTVLSNSFGFGGSNSCLVFKRVED